MSLLLPQNSTALAMPGATPSDAFLVGAGMVAAWDVGGKAIADRMISCLSQALFKGIEATQSVFSQVQDCEKTHGEDRLRRAGVQDFNLSKLERVVADVKRRGNTLEMHVAQGKIYGVGHVGVEFTEINKITGVRTKLFSVGHYPEKSADFLKFYKVSKGKIRVGDPILAKGNTVLKSYTLSGKQIPKVFQYFKETQESQYNAFGWGAPNCRDFVDGLIQRVSKDKLSCFRWCEVQ